MSNIEEQFEKEFDARCGNSSLEDQLYVIDDIVEEHPELAEEGMKKYESLFSETAQTDTAEFIKYWGKKLSGNRAFNYNGLELEHLSGYLGTFVAKNPEFSERGLKLIKKVSSALCHDNASLGGCCKALGYILGACPPELENEVLATWKKFAEKKSKFKENNNFYFYQSYNYGLEDAAQKKPHLAPKIAQVLTSAIQHHKCDGGQTFGRLKSCWRALVAADNTLGEQAARSLYKIRNSKTQEETESAYYTLTEFHPYLPKSERADRTQSEVNEIIWKENHDRIEKLRARASSLEEYFTGGRYIVYQSSGDYMQPTFEPRKELPDWKELGDKAAVKKLFSSFLKSPAKITSVDFGQASIAYHEDNKHYGYFDAWKASVVTDKNEFFMIYPGEKRSIEVVTVEKRLDFKPHPQGYRIEGDDNEEVLLESKLISKGEGGVKSVSEITTAQPVYEYDGNRIELTGADVKKINMTVYNNHAASMKRIRSKKITAAEYKKYKAQMDKKELKSLDEYQHERWNER